MSLNTFHLADILVLVGDAIPPAPSVPVNTRISAEMCPGTQFTRESGCRTTDIKDSIHTHVMNIHSKYYVCFKIKHIIVDVN